MPGARYFLDSNIFLRVIAKDNPKKVAECERLIQAVAEGRLRAVTSPLVVAEVVWTCLSFYRLKKSVVIELLRGLVSLKHLKIQSRLNIFAAFEYYEASGVKFIDALIAAETCFSNGQARLVSYDKDFDKLGLVRLEPAEII